MSKDEVVLDIFRFFFQAEDGIRDVAVTGVQTCALPISLNPIAARYADAGLAVRRVTGDAAAIERALGQPAAPDAIVATAAAAAAAEQAWADAGRPGVLTSLSEDPDPVAVRLDLRPWGAGRVLLVEPGAAGLAPRSDLIPSANPLP